MQLQGSVAPPGLGFLHAAGTWGFRPKLYSDAPPGAPIAGDPDSAQLQKARVHSFAVWGMRSLALRACISVGA